MKKFVLARGDSGLLFVMNRAAWKYMETNEVPANFTFVADSNNLTMLEQMESLANKQRELDDEELTE